MTLNLIKYKQTVLSLEDILNYLMENDEIFKPKLSTRLYFNEYAAKLHRYATHFCAYYNNRLIAIVACYFNNFIERSGYISSVSVKREFQRKGIVKQLLAMVIDYARKNGFDNLKLEVRIENLSVGSIYRKFGFREIYKNESVIGMELKILL